MSNTPSAIVTGSPNSLKQPIIPRSQLYLLLLGLIGLLGITTWYIKQSNHASMPPPDSLEHSLQRQEPLAFTAYAHHIDAEDRPQEEAVLPLKEDSSFYEGQSLTFVLHNHTGKPGYFMLFGMDKEFKFYWFYPEVDEAKQNTALPMGIDIDNYLPEAVIPSDIPVGEFALVGLFLPYTATITEVIDAFENEAKSAEEILHGHVQLIPLRVETN